MWNVFFGAIDNFFYHPGSVSFQFDDQKITKLQFNNILAGKIVEKTLTPHFDGLSRGS